MDKQTIIMVNRDGEIQRGRQADIGIGRKTKKIERY
jgi:hypothetical protein